MSIKTLFSTLRDRFEAHRRYRHAIAEIEMLTQKDLMDMGAFQVDLYRAAREQYLGQA